MVGNINYDSGSDTITINGGGYDDVAEVRFSGNRVYVDLVAEESNGETDHYDDDWRISDVQWVVFNGFAGDDTLTVTVEALNSGVSVSSIGLGFLGGEDDDQLFQHGGGIGTIAEGGSGNDRLEGSRFADWLMGDSGGDVYVFAGSSLGDDFIASEPANADSDTLDFSNFGQAVDVNLSKWYGELDEYAVDSAALQLAIFDSTAIENVIGTAYGDHISGNSRDNSLEGRGGNDTYHFAGGNHGFDTIVEAANLNTDTLDFTNLPASTLGIGVNVNLAVASPQYAVNSPHARLLLSNAAAIENVFGTPFEDTIVGNSRDNYLYGGYEDDDITGGEGNDKLEGSKGDDIYHFAGKGLGIDEIIEEAKTGNDGLRFTGMLAGVTIDLNQFGSSYAVNSKDLKLKLANDTAIERVWGTDFNDIIIGNSRNNRLMGRGGNDSIIGSDGADYIHGGDEQDWLLTDALDEVYGGEGPDTIDYMWEPWYSNPDPTRYKDWGV
jgi:Ca2+-binding RTX toxin-like protein